MGWQKHYFEHCYNYLSAHNIMVVSHTWRTVETTILENIHEINVHIKYRKRSVISQGPKKLQGRQKGYRRKCIVNTNKKIMRGGGNCCACGVWWRILNKGKYMKILHWTDIKIHKVFVSKDECKEDEGCR